MNNKICVRPGILIQENTFPICTLYNKLVPYSVKHGGIRFNNGLIDIDFMQGIYDGWDGCNVHRNYIQDLRHIDLGIFRELAIYLQRIGQAEIIGDKFVIGTDQILITHENYESFINLYIQEAHNRCDSFNPSSIYDVIANVRKEDTRFSQVYDDEVLLKSIAVADGEGGVKSPPFIKKYDFYQFCLEPLEYCGIIEVFRRGHIHDIKDIRFCAYKFL